MNTNKKNISFLLGAGFSSPLAYPLGSKLNQAVLDIKKENFQMTPDGKLVKCSPGRNRTAPNDLHNAYLDCCLDLVRKFNEVSNEKFDYESFFEFLAQKEYLINPYFEVVRGYATYPLTVDLIDSNLDSVYVQIISFLLKDKNGKWRYDSEEDIKEIEAVYDNFLSLLSALNDEFNVYIHTLNHDLIFESFNNTHLLNNMISDGFDEIGSNFYGIFYDRDTTPYIVRLPRFTNRYGDGIKLYKLHGSLDYVLYHKTLKDKNRLIPYKYVKITKGIGVDGIIRDIGFPSRYESYPFPYHANFLTGTTSKEKNYTVPFLFKSLFEHFENNLQNSEILIIIGYGFKDKKINDLIIENFGGTKIYIVDPYLDINNIISCYFSEIRGLEVILTKKGVTELLIDDVKLS